MTPGEILSRQIHSNTLNQCLVARVNELTEMFQWSERYCTCVSSYVRRRGLTSMFECVWVFVCVRVSIFVCGGWWGAVCNWSQTVSHMPLCLWSHPLTSHAQQHTDKHAHTHTHTLAPSWTHLHVHTWASLHEKRKALHFIRKVNTSAVWSG